MPAASELCDESLVERGAAPQGRSPFTERAEFFLRKVNADMGVLKHGQAMEGRQSTVADLERSAEDKSLQLRQRAERKQAVEHKAFVRVVKD